MARRTSTLGLLGILALAGSSWSQSNVRPVPVVAHAPDLVMASRRAAAAPVDSDALWLSLDARPAAPVPEWAISMDIEGTLAGAGDLQGFGGGVSVQRGSWDASLTREGDARSYTLFLGAQATFHDWSASAPFVAGSRDPFNDLYETRIGGVASFQEDETLGWFTGVELTLAGEDAADPLDSLVVGAVSGVSARADEDLSFSFGVAVLTRLEDTPWLLPYFGFDWRLSERFRLSTEGARVELEATLSEAWSATLASEYSIQQARLNGANAIPSGVYQDDRITASAGLRWAPNERTTLDLEAGAILWEEHTFLSSTGTNLATFESGQAGFVGLGLNFDI